MDGNSGIIQNSSCGPHSSGPARNGDGRITPAIEIEIQVDMMVRLYSQGAPSDVDLESLRASSYREEQQDLELGERWHGMALFWQDSSRANSSVGRLPPLVTCSTIFFTSLILWMQLCKENPLQPCTFHHSQ